MPEKSRLYTLLGDYPNTTALKKGEVTSDLIDFVFADVKVSNTAFKPLVREGRFDLGELAIVTYLQAKAYGNPMCSFQRQCSGRTAPYHRLQRRTWAFECVRPHG